MKAVEAAFNQEKALVGAFSVITNLRMELFQALLHMGPPRSSLSCLADSTLTESRVLAQCIDNIEEVAATRLEVTQRIIDIELELAQLEEREYAL